MLIKIIRKIFAWIIIMFSLGFGSYTIGYEFSKAKLEADFNFLHDKYSSLKIGR